MSLRNKKILIGITGSIAAYKAAILIRLLIKEGAEVKVVMTRAAEDFITPLSISTLSKNPVYSSFSDPKTGLWNNHVDLGLWADAFIIAPASANTIAKCTYGICDNLLIATYLSAKCPVFLAPAMDLDMYQHPSTKENLKKLSTYHNHIIPSNYGELASGLVGEGRMAEPEEILAYINFYFNGDLPLKGKKAIITAGPTYEPIDPVRFIGNHSSGKMGYALAEKLCQKGAEVTLISGPTNITLSTCSEKIKIIKVSTAEEMFQEVDQKIDLVDICILSAAVADYKPSKTETQKIKKKDKDPILTLTKTIDIAATIGKRKKKHQIFIGFALETENEEANALKKLKSKNFDFIVLNSLNDTGAGFGHDTNKISILHQNGEKRSFGLKSKKEVAEDIIDTLLEILKN